MPCLIYISYNFTLQTTCFSSFPPLPSLLAPKIFWYSLEGHMISQNQPIMMSTDVNLDIVN